MLGHCLRRWLNIIPAQVEIVPSITRRRPNADLVLAHRLQPDIN